VTAAPLSAESLHPALTPFGEGTMLPAAAYTSPEVLAGVGGDEASANTC